MVLWNRVVLATLFSLRLVATAHAETFTCSDGVHHYYFFDHQPGEECKGLEIRILNKDGSLNRTIPGRPLTPKEQARQQQTREELEWCRKYPDALRCGGAHDACLTHPGSNECRSESQGAVRQASGSRDSGPSTTQPATTR